ncbi:MAG TPA: tetratricopeptide repeat protein [Candidatus Ozemobacteraceae bacterium]|nr:tetratricopeptide repeat protein [Candidatus Ozemobacteraceae bacterium]
MKPRTGRFQAWLLLLATLLWAVSAANAAVKPDYTTLKKYISARMLSEAYLELMRCELQNKEEDPKLTKLRKDLLKPVREEAGKRVKVTPDDPAVCLILGDVEFHEGRFDASVGYLSRALEKKDDALSHYTFAKVLFAKGNVPQSFEQLEKALQIDPSSELLFDDFQFLYNAKNYGLASARRLTGKAGFTRRATPVAGERSAPQMPENPFENDPTAPPDVPLPPEPQPEPDLLQTAQVPVTVSLPATDPATSPADGEPPIDQGDDILPDETEPPPQITIASAPEVAAEDPERKKMKDAEYWFDQAKKKFADGKYEDAEATLKKAQTMFAGLPGREELQAKIDEKKGIDQKYKFAVSLYQSEKYDLALPDILRAYEENPQKYAEATFYLGKIYILGSNRDLKKARTYFEKFQSLPDVDPDLKRDVDWVMIGILTDDQQYQEANERFNHFLETESEYAKNQPSFWKLKYTLWSKIYTTEIMIGLGLFLGAFLIVFILMVAPALNLFISDPVKKATLALEAGQNEKAVRISEDALRRPNVAVQLQRQLLEISIQAHYALKNYFKCQENARHLLTLFADNAIGWKYLAKAYLETNTASDEAITMYETIYKQDPSRTEFLPILSKFYRAQKQYTGDAMEIMYACFQADPANRENVTALADAYVQSKRMGDEVVVVLREALKTKPDGDGYRELLARNYSKKGMFAESAKECLQVLATNVNNMGIHVVYTTCMKKMNMLDEAVLQYEEFLRRHPGNPQLTEIVTGLRKELEQNTQAPESLSGTDELSPFSEELLTEGLPPLTPETELPSLPSDTDIEGFVEPPPEGFVTGDTATPLPDFLKPPSADQPATSSSGGGARSVPLAPTTPAKKARLEPMGLHDTDLIDTPLPAPEPPFSPATTTSADSGSGPTVPPGASAADDILSIPTLDPFAEHGLDGSDIPDDLGLTPPESVTTTATAAPPKPDTELADAIAEARQKAAQKKWDEVVALLTPVFASKRSKEIGLLLADAHLRMKKPALAREIIETLEFDRELMSDELKDLLYRVGTALEASGDTSGALMLYDMICNVDINFRDTFDRSDKLYASLKKGK